MKLIINLTKIYATIFFSLFVAGTIVGGIESLKKLRAENNKPLFKHSPEFTEMLNHYERKAKVTS